MVWSKLPLEAYIQYRWQGRASVGIARAGPHRPLASGRRCTGRKTTITVSCYWENCCDTRCISICFCFFVFSLGIVTFICATILKLYIQEKSKRCARYAKKGGTSRKEWEGGEAGSTTTTVVLTAIIESKDDMARRVAVLQADYERAERSNSGRLVLLSVYWSYNRIDVPLSISIDWYFIRYFPILFLFL